MSSYEGGCNELYIPRYERLPSLVGRDVIELERHAILPRKNTYDALRSFLETARNDDEVNVLFIKAEWGEGKSSIYEGYLHVSDVIGSDLVVRIDAGRLITIIREDYKKFCDYKSIGIRFFATLIYGIRDVVNSSTVSIDHRLRGLYLPSKSEKQDTLTFIRESLNMIFSRLPPNSRLFIFLDEFEDVVDIGQEREYGKQIQEIIINGIVNMINGEPDILCKKGEYAGRVHLIVAITPPAYELLVRRMLSASNIGRLLGQRVRVIELEKVSRRDAYHFILGCLKYCWNNKLPSLPFTDLGIINAIYLITHGNPRGMVELIRILLSSAINGERIKVITAHDFITYLMGQKITIYGGEVEILERETIRKVFSEVEREARNQGLDAGRAVSLLELLIASPVPLSVNYLLSRTGISDNRTLRTYISIVAAALSKVRKVNAVFLRFRKAKLLEEEAEGVLLRIMNALTYYTVNETTYKLEPELYIPSDDLRYIRTFNPELFQQYIEFFLSSMEETLSEDEIVTEIETNLRNRAHILSEEECYMLTPVILSMFYTLPSMFLLDFIKNVSDRFNLSMEVRRRTTEYEREFCKGVYYLLKDGNKDIVIEREIESSGPFSLEVYTIEIKFGPQSYKFRTHIFPQLTWNTRHEEIRERMDMLRQFSVPLIMVFAWNYIPEEVKTAFETSDLIRNKIARHLYFTLETKHIYPIIARVLAEERGYEIIESRWKNRASQIIEEIRFKDVLQDWITQGEKEGYTLTPLNLGGMSIKELSRAFRTFLITEGTYKQRYERLIYFDRNFRIWGKEFSLNPLDIASPQGLLEKAQILSSMGFLELSGEDVRIKSTNIEERILSILAYYSNGLSYQDLEKMFVIVSGASLGPYINVLMERRKIIEDRGVLRIFTVNDLWRRFLSLKNEILSRERNYSYEKFGYIISRKHRNRSFINVREYIGMLKALMSNIEELRNTASDDEWIQKFLLFEKLAEHFLDNVDELLREFIKKINELRNQLPSPIELRRRIEKLKNDLSVLGLRRISFKEEQEIQTLEVEIPKLINRESFTDDEINNILRSLEPRLPQIQGDFIKKYGRGECYAFEIKILKLSEYYQRLQRLSNQISENIRNATDRLSSIYEIGQQLRQHGLLSNDWNQETIVSRIVRVYRKILKHIPFLVDAQTLVNVGNHASESDLVELSLRELPERLDTILNCLTKVKERVDNHYKLISQIHEKEIEIHELLGSIINSIRWLYKFFENSQEYLNKLSSEEQEYRGIDLALKDYGNRIYKPLDREDLSLDELDELKEEYEELLRILNQNFERLKEVINSLSTIFESSKKLFEEKIHALDTLFSRLERVMEESSGGGEELKEQVRTLKVKFEEIRRSFPGDFHRIDESEHPKNTFKGIITSLEELRESIKTLFTEYGVLNRLDVEVLDYLVSLNMNRVDIPLILDDLMEKTGLNPSQLIEILLELSYLGLIKLEVSI
jgi:hypothetical protein